MPENIQTALVLFAVGMITVFIILGLVVLTGKVLIRVINAVGKDKKELAPVSEKHLTDAQIAAIVATVDMVTAGRGNIKSIEQIMNDG